MVAEAAERAGHSVRLLDLMFEADPLRAIKAELGGAAFDVIGLSVLSGAHNQICPRVMELVRQHGLDDVLVVVGGIIPDVDVPRLHEIGIRGIFRPGSGMNEILEFIQRNVRTRAEA